jgi:hypothetical protein
MAGKNKGGREARKPKKDKKTRAASTTSVIPSTSHRAAKDQPAKPK